MIASRARSQFVEQRFQISKRLPGCCLTSTRFTSSMIGARSVVSLAMPAWRSGTPKATACSTRCGSGLCMRWWSPKATAAMVSARPYGGVAHRSERAGVERIQLEHYAANAAAGWLYARLGYSTMRAVCVKDLLRFRSPLVRCLVEAPVERPLLRKDQDSHSTLRNRETHAASKQRGLCHARSYVEFWWR